jgi:hypothetical protein
MTLHFDVKFLLRQKTKVRLAKFTVLALVLIFTAVAAPLFAWAAEKTQFRFKGLVALAFFDGVEGCIATTVGVRATSGTESVGPGKPGNVSEVEAFVEQFDICLEEVLLNVEGAAPVSAAEFQIDKKLESARVTKTVTLTDESGNSLDVSVNLTWTATSQPEVSTNRFYIRTPGSITHEQNKGTFREASAEGTVSSGGTNLLQNLTDTFSNLQSVTDGFRDITKF